jgi:hypothetical protein
MYKKKTLRRMKPITRRYARIINDLDGIIRRLKNLTDDIARLEFDSHALHNARECQQSSGPNNLDEFMADYLNQPEEDDEL